jgi:hypothetical protein
MLLLTKGWCFNMRQFFFICIFALPIMSQSSQQCRQLFAEKFTIASYFFSSSQLLQLSLKSNFSLIAKNSEQKIQPNKLQKSFPTEIEIGESLKILGLAKAFGDSSTRNDEAPFRKLQITLKDADGQMTSFFINTHMARDPEKKWSSEGRLHNGMSPFREALVYDFAHLVDVKTGAYRRAMIQYTNADTGEVFTEQALLLENFTDSAKKNNQLIANENTFYQKKSNSEYGSPNVNISEAVRAQLLQILIGNTDYHLEIYNTRVGPTEYYQQLKNVVLFRKQGSNEMQPVIYDFDVASMVVGHEINDASKPWEHLPEVSPDPVTMVMLRRLLKLRSLIPEAELRSQIDNFIRNQKLFFDTIQKAQIDNEGRDLAINHIDHFFKAVDMMWDPKFNFMMSENIKFNETPGKKNLLKRNKADDRPGTLRPGTPFVILANEGDFLKILLVDTNYDLQNHEKRVGYIRKNAIYSTQLPSNKMPYFDSRALFQ